jgi:LPXTG-site transpeptidase (sortase) family protein
MNWKIPYRLGIAIVVIFSGSIFSLVAIHALLYAPENYIAIPQQMAIQTSATSSEPTRLIIPSLNINANIQHVGITQNHAMGTPNNFTDVAWYKYGPAPGDVGSAVIDGHVDNGLSLAGVFKHLVNIKIGDRVIVVAKDGSEKQFVVTNIETYPYQNTPTNTIFNSKNDIGLNLITCEGAWVPGGRTYDHRLVVYTKLVSA